MKKILSLLFVAVLILGVIFCTPVTFAQKDGVKFALASDIHMDIQRKTLPVNYPESELYFHGGGTIVNCENTAKVTASDAYAGGMVGRIEDDRCTFTDNTNSGTVSAPRYCGNTCGYDGRTKTTY